ncbi:PE-PPE domain-containing protein [Mycobacterium sp.]|uniref:PE-PPE domain-containing protein n=1 Tax=Mycobacterium sp. TaxID=1785 RepID=UPI001285F916|nr:PE-PPE domain-containing protein [Mycobacterium sp.]KAA8958688.1 MAG: PE-PPE domain-containing protein [Mycobacterium sp.]
MVALKLLWPIPGMLASVGAGLLTLSSMMAPVFAYGDAPDGTDPAPGSIGLVMGGTGEPIPGSAYVDVVSAVYIEPRTAFPGQPTFPGTTYPGTLANGLVTPENAYPLTGVNSLPLSTSVSEGVTILNNSIQANLADGDTSIVFGSSQSSIISSLEMEALDPSGTPSSLPVNFVFIGSEMNPNGGLFERFVGLDVTSLGIRFYGAFPTDDFTTVSYTAEYDGFADFPRYPIDFLSDLNGFAGFLFLQYPVTSAQLATAIELPTSGVTETTYYMIPTTNLPLLDPVRDIPIIGNPIADLLQPDLTYLVNLGYGDPLYGWSTSPANIPTPFGLFPSLSDIQQLPGLLVSGAEQGIENFVGDFIGTGPNPVTLSLGSLLDPSSATTGATSALAELSTGLSALVSDPASSLADLVNTLSSVASAAYGVLLPTVDIANALLTSLPAYDASLFVDNVAAGNLLDAVGLPIAADVGVGTFAAGIEFDAVASAVSTIIGDLASLAP